LLASQPRSALRIRLQGAAAREPPPGSRRQEASTKAKITACGEKGACLEGVAAIAWAHVGGCCLGACWRGDSGCVGCMALCGLRMRCRRFRPDRATISPAAGCHQQHERTGEESVATDLSEASDADELLICTAVHGGLLGQGLRSPLAHALMRAAPPRLPPHTHTRTHTHTHTHTHTLLAAIAGPLADSLQAAGASRDCR
jgi:hypothetical protein